MEKHVVERLMEAVLKISETRVLTPLLINAMDLAIELMDAEYGYLVLVNEDGSLDFRVKRNTTGVTVTDEEIKVSASIIHHAIQTREVVITNANTDPLFIHSDSVHYLDIRAVICLPLIVRDNPIGSLYLENRNNANPFDFQYSFPLRLFANQAAVAIESAMRYDHLEEMVQQRTRELEEANKKLSQEIAERKRMESEVIDLAVEQEKSRILTSFIQDASHQFRTPLSIINLNLDIIERKYADLAKTEYFFNIRDQSANILDLIESLVTMVRLDAGQDSTQSRINMNNILETLYESNEPQALQKSHTLEFNYDADGATLIGDEWEITRAIDAVIDNAVQYTPDGGLINVNLSSTPDAITIVVRDNGQGIRPEDSDRIFTRFFKGDTARTTHGFGFGLAVVKKVMENHHGTITVESKPEMGSTFTLRFPLESID